MIQENSFAFLYWILISMHVYLYVFVIGVYVLYKHLKYEEM